MRRRPALLAAALAMLVLAGIGVALWPGGVFDRVTGPPAVEHLCRGGPVCRVTMLARLATAPFPFVPEPRSEEPPAAGDYRDDRVLIHVPPGFDPARPFRVLLYFHGNRATLTRTVMREHAVPAQVNESGRNVILVAPQLAYDSADSHPGKLLRSGAVDRLVDDALGKAAAALGVPAPSLADGPVIIAAYSGGWWPATASVSRGGLDGRIDALILLDAFYGGETAFADWAGRRQGEAVVVALYTRSSEAGARAFLGLLAPGHVRIASGLPPALTRGTVALVRVETPHPDVPVKGPPLSPIAEILRRLPPFDDNIPDPAARLPTGR